MRNKVFTGTAILIAFVAGMSVAAVQPSDPYDRAAQAIQGEEALLRIFSFDELRSEEARKRADYWAKEMEQFKP